MKFASSKMCADCEIELLERKKFAFELQIQTKLLRKVVLVCMLAGFWVEFEVCFAVSTDQIAHNVGFGLYENEFSGGKVRAKAGAYRPYASKSGEWSVSANKNVEKVVKIN